MVLVYSLVIQASMLAEKKGEHLLALRYYEEVRRARLVPMPVLTTHRLLTAGVCPRLCDRGLARKDDRLRQSPPHLQRRCGAGGSARVSHHIGECGGNGHCYSCTFIVLVSHFFCSCS